MLRFREVRLGDGDEVVCRRCLASGTVKPTASSAGLAGTPEVDSAGAGDVGLFFTGTGALGLDDLLGHAARIAAAGFARIGIRTSGEHLADTASMGRLLESGVRVVEVVFLGSGPEYHDALSGTPGSFEHAVAAIRSCAEAAEALGVKAAVRGRVRVCAHNLQDAPATVMRLAELGVTSIVLDCDPQLDVRRSAEWVAAACDTGTVNRVWVAVSGMPEGALGEKGLHVLDVIMFEEGVA